MNYEEMSNDKINELVTIAVIKQTHKNIKAVESDVNQGCVWVETVGFSSWPILDYCNNPADWANLISVIISDPTKGIKIEDTGVIISDYGDFNLEDVEVRDINTGRAISICYLKMKEANNNV